MHAIRREKRGFAHACNIGLRTCDARFSLLLNGDTEASGSFADLVSALDDRAKVRAAAVLQVGP